MAFRVVALIDVVAVLLAQVVAVAVALRGGEVWALVSLYVVTHWIVALLAWRSARWRPSLYLSPSLFRRMAVFGVNVSGFEVVQTARMVVESWIITVTLGPSAMGFLSIARRVVQVAQELIAASLVSVSTVVFAKVRDSVDRMRGAYLKALGVVYASVSPLMVLIVVTAPVLVPLLVGKEWGPSVAPAQALAVAGIVTLGAMLDRGLFYGLGRPGTWLAYSVVVDVTTLGATAFGVRWGLIGVSVGFVVVATLATVARWILVSRLVGLTVGAIVRPFVAVLVPTVLTLAVGTLLFRAVAGVDWVIVGLVGVGTVIVVVNLALLRLFAARILRNALDVLPLPERYSRRAERLLRLEPLDAA
jgi:O-antigen/teichoic acid export membrane protein